jgi:putative transposase
MSQLYNSLSHSKWDCVYHIIFVPKMRKKTIYGDKREALKQIFHSLAVQKDCKIVEGYLMPDHVHMMIEIPPKIAVSSVVGFLKGKSAIIMAREFGGKQRNFNGENFWAKGYAVSTVGFEKTIVKKYIQDQQKEDQRLSGQGSF